MTDEVKKATLDKPLDVGKVTKPDGSVTFGAPQSIHQRIANAAKIREEDARKQTSVGGPKYINFGRIFILPDSSGSMDGRVDDTAEGRFQYGRRASYDNERHTTRLDMLKKAVDEYLKNCLPSVNLVGIASFPEGAFSTPSNDYNMIRSLTNELAPNGGTPMADAMGYVMETETFSHAVLISDGCPDNASAVEELALEYKTKKITVDCVHIGSDTSGTELMKKVAEITGGSYIKFTDVTAFSKAFSYLAPTKRSLLQAHKNPVALLGCSDIKL